MWPWEEGTLCKVAGQFPFPVLCLVSSGSKCYPTSFPKTHREVDQTRELLKALPYNQKQCTRSPGSCVGFGLGPLSSWEAFFDLRDSQALSQSCGHKTAFTRSLFQGLTTLGHKEMFEEGKENKSVRGSIWGEVFDTAALPLSFS